LGDWIGLMLRAGLFGGVLILWWLVRRESLTQMAALVALAATFVVTVAIQQPWFVYNLILLVPPIYLLLAALDGASRAAAASPPRLLSAIAIGGFVAPWAVYLALYGAYLARLVPVAGLGWPGYAALYLLIQRALVGLTLLTLVFAYLAWVGPARRHGESSGLRSNDQPPRLPTRERSTLAGQQ
jgi:hypothetical protein